MKGKGMRAMGEKPAFKVSVVIAVYNAETFLRQCLDSVAGQTLRDMEIICVNDGSTDGSLKVLEEYARQDSRFYIYTKENEGLGGASARNYGLERARGEYVSILDSDDFFEPDMLEKAVGKADRTGADFVIFGGFEYDNKNGNTYKVTSILNEKAIPDKEVFSCHDCPDTIFQLSQGMAWNKLYRQSFLEQYQLRFQKIKYTDDAYFTFAHMVLAEKITVLKEYLCYYRINTGSSQTDGLDHYPDSAYLPYTALKASFVEWGVYDEVRQSFMNCAVSFMRYFYDKITDYHSFRYLHNQYRNEIFEKLDIKGKPRGDFYDERTFLWCQQVLANSPGEIAFKSARAHGSDMTTGVLRFLFPYSQIPRGGKIAVLGAGIMGRHYYSQLMLSGYCDVVVWAEAKNPFQLSYIQPYETLRKVDFDYALIAYAQEGLIQTAISYLDEIGKGKIKIIIGGANG